MVFQLICLFALFVLVAKSQNPFEKAKMYIDADYKAEIAQAVAQYPNQKELLESATQPAAYWIDSMSRISNVTRVLEGAKSAGELTIFVIYDLPNRDCAAAASNGEIVCEDSTCAAGLNTYKTKYIDPIVSIFKKYEGQPIVCIIEPDSLPNLATNMDIEKCKEAETAYKSGIEYAIQQLSTISSITMYIDAAHGGWLGWDNNRQAAAQIFKEVVDNAGGASKIRGFITNTANYQPLGSMSDTSDPCHLETQYNQAINEVKYINLLSQSLNSVGLSGVHFLIDTSRNGVPNARQDCSNWCNIKGAGMGVRPTTDTSSSGLDIIDAYVWIKVPGESDGTTNTTSPRYDYHCTSEDSVVPMPNAGVFYPPDFLMLAQNANPPLN